MIVVTGITADRRNINRSHVIRERNDAFQEGDSLNGSLFRVAQLLRRELGDFAGGRIKLFACIHGFARVGR